MRSDGVDVTAPFATCLTFSVSPADHFRVSVHGISIPPWGRSSEHRLDPVTLRSRVPPHLKDIEHVDDIFLRMCPTVLPMSPLQPQKRLGGYLHLTHDSSSQTAAVHISWYGSHAPLPQKQTC